MAKISPLVPIVMFTQHASTVLDQLAKEVGIRAVVSKTEAFSMVSVIESLLGSDDPKTSPALPETTNRAQPEEV
jgi:hypothetical protein